MRDYFQEAIGCQQGCLRTQLRNEELPPLREVVETAGTAQEALRGPHLPASRNRSTSKRYSAFRLISFKRAGRGIKASLHGSHQHDVAGAALLAGPLAPG